ncbi:malate dehydrogenase, partial [Enterococcus hirae]
ISGDIIEIDFDKNEKVEFDKLVVLVVGFCEVCIGIVLLLK